MEEEQEKGKPEFEKILADVGHYGAFQKNLVRWFLFPGVVPLAWFSLNIVFFMSVPDHWCYVSELVTSNLSVEEQKIIIRPMQKQRGEDELSHCEMHDFNYSQILVDLLEGSEVRSILSRHNSTSNVPCPSGWMYDQTLYDSTASRQWDLVCDKDPLPNLVFTLTGVGSVLSTPIYGTLSDRIGRKLTFFLCVFVTLVSGIASLFVPSFTAFLVLRMINGGLSPTLFQLPYILLFEIVGKDKRTEIMSIGSIAWTVGLCTLPLFAFLLRDWVLLGIVTTCFCVPYFLYWRFLPESPRWLVSMKRYDEAVIILTRIAERNGNPVPSNLLERLKKVEEEAEREKQSNTSHNVIVLFRYRNLRKHFILLTLIWISISIAYNSLQLNVTNLYGNEFINFFLLGIVELPSYFLCWYLMEKIGRRWTNVGLMFMVGLSALIPTVVYSKIGVGFTIGSLVGKFGSSGALMVIGQQAAELYPTPVRSVGIAGSSTIAWVGTILAPYILYSGTYDYRFPFLIIGGVSLVASVAASFLPETLHANLPQTIEDGENFGLDQKFFSCIGHSWFLRSPPETQSYKSSLSLVLQEKEGEKNN